MFKFIRSCSWAFIVLPIYIYAAIDFFTKENYPASFLVLVVWLCVLIMSVIIYVDDQNYKKLFKELIESFDLGNKAICSLEDSVLNLKEPELFELRNVIKTSRIMRGIKDKEAGL